MANKAEKEWIEVYFVADHPDTQRRDREPALFRFKARDFGDSFGPHGHRIKAQGEIAVFHARVISRCQVATTSGYAFERWKARMLAERDSLKRKLADIEKRIDAFPESVAELPIVNAVRGET